MTYDFDKLIDRRNTNSYKWNVGKDELPMWVADMDFETASEIKEAIIERAMHGAYGYNCIPNEWNKAYVNWWGKRHSLKIKEEWLIFCTGVIPAISSIVRKVTTPAEKVLVQTPCYNNFFNSIINNGRLVLESPLKYENNEYSVDFCDLESKLSDPQTSLMILCNPQNPVGKIWDKDTLNRIGELCKKYNVTVLSDEIHCDITSPGVQYVPFASVSEICKDISITCMAPTKTFNLAGIQTAAVMVPNDFLRHKVWRGLNTDEVAEPNSFAITAAVTAFNKGEKWLDELRVYIEDNKKYCYDFIDTKIPEIKAIRSNATYLLWLDCSKICDDANVFSKYLRKKTGLYLCAGNQYGSGGNCFLRINLACPRKTLIDGLSRLEKGVKEYSSCVL